LNLRFAQEAGFDNSPFDIEIEMTRNFKVIGVKIGSGLSKGIGHILVGLQIVQI